MTTPRTNTKNTARFRHLPEDALRREILTPLFRAMGFRGVSITHGIHERGKDIVMWKPDEFGQRVNTAVVVKQGSISGRASGGSDAASTVAFQIRQALGSCYTDPVDGTEQRPSHVIVAASGNISAQTVELIMAGVDMHYRGVVRFVDGAALEELVDKHIPESNIVRRSAELQKIINKAAERMRIDVKITPEGTAFDITSIPGARIPPIEISFRDPATPEGQVAAGKLREHLQTGKAASFTREMIETILVPEELEALGLRGESVESLFLSNREGGALSLLLEIEAPGLDAMRLGPFRTKAVRVGTEELLIRSVARHCGWEIAICAQKRAGKLNFTFQVELGGLNVREQLQGMLAVRALARGSRCTLLAADSELAIFSKTLIDPPIDEFSPTLVDFARALLALQEYSGQPFSIPSESLERRHVEAIMEAAALIERGSLEGTWSDASITIGAPGARRILELCAGGRGELMATNVPLKVWIGDAQVEVGDQEVVLSKACLKPEDALRVEREVAEGKELISVALTPDGGMPARVIRRLLPRER